jgi:hypothetical protein
MLTVVCVCGWQFAREEIMPKAAHHDKTGEYPCAKKQFRFALWN